jgi:type II secretory pathway pseudopilin PulG
MSRFAPVLVTVCSPRPSHRRAEHGSVSVFAVVAATILVMFVGVAVDLGAKVHTLQLAQDAARQAARAAGEAAHAPSAVRGDPAVVDPGRAVQAGQAYLEAVGIDGSVTVAGDLVTVRTTATYVPVILAIAGIGPQTVTGSSTARLERTVQGVRQ